jgi:hypothetical protein
MKLLYDRKSSRLRRKPCHNSWLMLKSRPLSILLERGNCKVIAAAHQPLGSQNSGPSTHLPTIEICPFRFLFFFLLRADRTSDLRTRAPVFAAIAV